MEALQGYLRPGDVLLTDNGTSYAIFGFRLPPKCTVVASVIWGSIGFSIGALLGTLTAAPERRHLLFIGDGSFQETAQELSTMLRNDCKPVIFLINNGGYTIERGYMGNPRTTTTSPGGPTPSCRRCSARAPQRGRSSSRRSPTWSRPSAHRMTA